ncbi:hypothetical protein Rsub_01728 [Raphidocelis subcapitata]|uniref:Major facilitator superfamily associated domain-containing protein n=1 Tax=Raphidocelis subcapitata TaxID=307507 RepID=A0A2V0NV55_9CHLO|nr:hypothetical protein Rsub_01728 [Raphidocelis subcapitata]|eukprot:GBF88827.1 hypothetical protein Rsub_01728 [Raphidocelis subcapitata]
MSRPSPSAPSIPRLIAQLSSADASVVAGAVQLAALGRPPALRPGTRPAQYARRSPRLPPPVRRGRPQPPQAVARRHDRPAADRSPDRAAGGSRGGIVGGTAHFPAAARAPAQHAAQPEGPAPAPAAAGAAKTHRDRQMLLAKCWFFFGGASGAVLFPYVPLYLDSRGLAPSQIGLVSALRPWIAAPAAVAASSAADARAAHGPLLLGGLAASAALRAGLPLAAAPGQLVAALLAAEGFSFFGVLGDATVLSNLPKDQEEGGGGPTYGDQRVWASVGWGVAGVAGGAAIRKWGLAAAPFWGFGALSVLLALTGAAMRYDYSSGRDGDESLQQDDGGGGGGEGQPLLARAAGGGADAAAAEAGAGAGGSGGGMRSLLLRPDVAVFLFEATMLGFGMGVCQGFEFLYLRQLGGGEALMGLCLLAMTVAEVPAFALQGPLLRRVPVATVIDGALLTLALRTALYAAVLPVLGPWAILPMELLHGITFAAAWGACTVHAAAVAPPALAASFQGVMQAAWLGLGTGLGGLAGGVLFERSGGPGLFSVTAGIMAASAAAAAAARAATKARRGGGDGSPPL